MKGSRGIALLNALVLVAAMSAAAFHLAGRAEESRMRLERLRDLEQAQLYLDGVALLVVQVLDTGGKAAGPVHEGQTWATEGYRFNIDRGEVGGEIHDLQGRFNVNRLSDAGDRTAREAMVRLARQLRLSPVLEVEIAAYMLPPGPVQRAAYLSRPVPVLPLGGTIALAESLRDIEGMTEADFRTLAPHVSALPTGTPLNVNTATPDVLIALLEGAAAQQIARLVEDRAQRPFSSVGDFRARAARMVPTRSLSALPSAAVSVSSNWFVADVFAVLGDLRLDQRLVLQRDPATGKARILYRVTSVRN